MPARPCNHACLARPARRATVAHLRCPAPAPQALCRSYAEDLMGGSIRIDGDYVNGTRTVVELPLPEPSAEAALALSQPQPSESPGAALAPGLSWLLVDDNASVRLAHRHTPSKAGTVPGITRALPGQPGNCPPRFLQLGRQPSGGFPAGFSAQLSFPNAPTAGQYRAGPAQASCHGTGHHTAALHAACTLHITHHRCRPLHCHTTTQQ